MNRRLYLILQSAAWRSQPAPPPVIQKTGPSGSEQPATEGAMTYTRMNVYNLPDAGQDQWPDWFLWYARGIKALQAKPITDKLSWRYYAAIHGFNAQVWNSVGQFAPVEVLPPQTEIDEYWNQCQHGTWYFLPWHRGYLIALEAALRDAISQMDNAPQDWSLCYWNYLNPAQNELPAPFRAQFMPNNEGANPLYVAQRYGSIVNSNVVNTSALNEPLFIGEYQVSLGFGGLPTNFLHAGSIPGGLENQPHNIVHGEIGRGGLMSYPDTAALDPIFWLHHANIDRLWEVWRQGGHADPTNPYWLGGPPSLGGRPFKVPKPGDLTWTFTPADMTDLATLGYTYESLDPSGLDQVAYTELVPLTPAPSTQSRSVAPAAKFTGEDIVSPSTPELVGANGGPVYVVGYEVQTVVQVDAQARPKLASLKPSGFGGASGNRLALNIEHIRGNQDAVTLSFFVTPPGVIDPTGMSDLAIGSIGLFGLTAASNPDGPHGGGGLTFVLDLTDVVSQQSWQGSDIRVRIVSLDPVPPEANIVIERISAYWRGG